MDTRLLFAIPSTLVTLLTLGALPGCTEPTGSERPILEARAVLRDAGGREIGTAHLAQLRSGGVQVEVAVAGISVGSHGVHVHAVGSCAASGTTPFGGAGGHFNPHAAAHGLHNPRGAHAGDLPNLEVGADGTGALGAVTERLTLTPGERSALDADGSAIVVHAGPDDQVSDPAGNSGARIACGVLELL